jgi:hypothetical protein
LSCYLKRQSQSLSKTIYPLNPLVSLFQVVQARNVLRNQKKRYRIGDYSCNLLIWVIGLRITIIGRAY